MKCEMGSNGRQEKTKSCEHRSINMYQTHLKIQFKYEKLRLLNKTNKKKKIWKQNNFFSIKIL